MNSDSPPVWLKSAALGLLVFTITGTILILILVLLGVSDPKPLGTLNVDVSFDNQPVEGWDTPAGSLVDGHYQIEIQAPDQQRFDELPYLIYCPCTLEVAARQISGESDSTYGLWWHIGSDSPYQIAAVNGNGYLAILESDGDSREPTVEWHTFPWLLPQGEINRIRVDIAANGDVLVRINDEVAANFTMATVSPIQVGFYAASSPRGGTTTAFEHLRIWQSEP